MSFGLDDVATGVKIAKGSLDIYGKMRSLFKNNKDYLFEEVNKKVFIRTNGNGFVVCSFDFYVINPNKIDSFIRLINITDARKSTEFPPFSTMKIAKNSKFFRDYAFWFSSENNIITDVIEYYDAPNKSMEKEQQDNPKYLGVKFIVDKNRIKKGAKYRVTYGYSVPGLFPVKNGKHDSEEFLKKDYGPHSSIISIEHISKKLRFAIYLEKGFRLSDVPKGFAIKGTNDNPDNNSGDACIVRDNILYTKYLYEVEHPERYKTIKIQWSLK